MGRSIFIHVGAATPRPKCGIRSSIYISFYRIRIPSSQMSAPTAQLSQHAAQQKQSTWMLELRSDSSPLAAPDASPAFSCAASPLLPFSASPTRPCPITYLAKSRTPEARQPRGPWPAAARRRCCMLAVRPAAIVLRSEAPGGRSLSIALPLRPCPSALLCFFFLINDSTQSKRKLVQELDSRFSETSSQLFVCSATLNPRDSFMILMWRSSLMNLAKLYSIILVLEI